PRAELAQAVFQRLAPLVQLQRRRLLDRRLGQPLQQRLAKKDPAALTFLAEVQDLVVGDAAAPGDEVQGWVFVLELVPHDQAGFLKHVVGVGAVGQQGQDVGVETTLVLQEQAEEEFDLRRLAGLQVVEQAAAGRLGVGFTDHADLEMAQPQARQQTDGPAVVRVLPVDVDAATAFWKKKKKG